VKKLIEEIKSRVIIEYDRTEVISIISLSKLIDGGAAIFAAVNRNHHIVIIGAIDIIPFVKNILRVCVISYLKFAIMNRAEDLRPWAIIIIRAPVKPQMLFDNIPASIKPI